MENSVDVLAAMDNVASGIDRPEEGLVTITFDDLWKFIEARNAVAELIEAATMMTEIDAHHGGFLCELCNTIERLRAAVALCKGEKND